jgi:hypothetical protein
MNSKWIAVVAMGLFTGCSSTTKRGSVVMKISDEEAHVSIGEGEVTQVLGKDYSVVKFPSGTRFSEGDTLEKHAH